MRKHLPSQGSVYGVELAYAGVIGNRLADVAGLSRLPVQVLDPAPLADCYAPVSAPAYCSTQWMENGYPYSAFARNDGVDSLFFGLVGAYHVHDEEIILQPRHGYDPMLAEHYLLGAVLSYWLERQSIPTFHAAAVVVDGAGVAFLSTNGGGKSGLAAALMQCGYPLLTDDILPVERHGDGFRARYGYATMRMWEDEARHFVGEFENLDPAYRGTDKRRVNVGAPDGFGRFYPHAVPLRALYIPERRLDTDDDAIRIEALSPAAATFALMQNTFIQQIASVAGFQRTRFQLFTDLVRSFTVKRLSYPTGFAHLPAVRAAILADLDQPVSAS